MESDLCSNIHQCLEGLYQREVFRRLFMLDECKMIINLDLGARLYTKIADGNSLNESIWPHHNDFQHSIVSKSRYLAIRS